MEEFGLRKFQKVFPFRQTMQSRPAARTAPPPSRSRGPRMGLNPQVPMIWLALALAAASINQTGKWITLNSWPCQWPRFRQRPAVGDVVVVVGVVLRRLRNASRYGFGQMSSERIFISKQESCYLTHPVRLPSQPQAGDRCQAAGSRPVSGAARVPFQSSARRLSCLIVSPSSVARQSFGCRRRSSCRCCCCCFWRRCCRRCARRAVAQKGRKGRQVSDPAAAPTGPDWRNGSSSSNNNEPATIDASQAAGSQFNRSLEFCAERGRDV